MKLKLSIGNTAVDAVKLMVMTGVASWWFQQLLAGVYIEENTLVSSGVSSGSFLRVLDGATGSCQNRRSAGRRAVHVPPVAATVY